MPDADASKYNCGRQYSALGGRGIIATALPLPGTAPAPKIKMDLDSVVLNIMAFLLSVYNTDRREDGIAVIELVGLYLLIARLGE